MKYSNSDLVKLVSAQKEVTQDFLLRFEPVIVPDISPLTNANFTFYAIETAIKLGDYPLVVKLTEHFLNSKSGPQLKEAMRDSLKMQVSGRPIYLLACVCSAELAAGFYTEKHPEYTKSQSHAPLLSGWKKIVEYLVDRLEINLSDMPTKHPALLHSNAADYITMVSSTSSADVLHQTPEQKTKINEMLAFVKDLARLQSDKKRPKLRL